MAVNPLASVSKVDQTVKTRVRRALTNAELASLFKHSPYYTEQAANPPGITQLVFFRTIDSF
jgi:hypothetical protein